MEKLKKEIDLRYRISQYHKLMKNYILNRMEKNNVDIIYEALIQFRQEIEKNQ